MILPDWMANIPPSLFENCSNLTSVTIAGTVSYIYDAAFAGCTSLTTVNYNGSKSDWGKIERAIGWHEGIPSVTEVTCENGEKCSLDYDGESSDPNSGATVPETVAALGSTAPTSGTYTLSTLAELQQIQAWVNAGKTLSGVTFVLASDIDTGTTKMIIGKYTNSGSEDRAFAGVFDGNGHTIKNTISTTSISFNTQFEALFAYVKGENAEIKNLTVDGTSTSNSIVGLLDGGATVDHCISKTTINVKVSDGVTNAFAIGGIVGSLKNGKITNCINAGTIGTIGNNSGTLYAGGIVGYVGDTQTSTKSLIENCINKGSLNFKSTVDAGGIAGIVSLKTQIIIRNCKNKGSVKTDNSISNDSSKVGGIVGSLTSADSIINNFNSGDVTVPNNTQNRSGGIVGYLGSSSIPVNANCNIGRADYGIVGKLPGGAQRQDILDYSRINYYLAATGSLGSSSDSEMKIWSDCEFTTSTAQNIVNNLSNSGDYKGWKLNNSGLPELDLGELDNICNSL